MKKNFQVIIHQGDIMSKLTDKINNFINNKQQRKDPSKGLLSQNYPKKDEWKVSFTENKLIDKSVKFSSAEEARKYGVKLPKKIDDSTQKKTKYVRKPATKIHYPRAMETGGGISTLGYQLDPKGPYRSPSDITRDIRESEQLARKIIGKKKKIKNQEKKE